MIPMMPTTFATGVRARGEPRALATLGAGLAAALLFALFHVAPLLSLVAIVCPVPLAVHRLRGGLGVGLQATAVAVALLVAFFQLGTALLFLVAFAAPGLLVAEGLARGRGLLRGCAWGFGLLVGALGLLLLFAAPRMAEVVLEPFAQMSTPQFLAELRGGGLPPERVEAFAEQARAWHAALSVVYPGAYVVLAALIVLANASVLRTYLARRDRGLLEGGEFEEIRFSLALAGAFLLAGFGVMLPATQPLAYNVLVVVAFFFAVQGLAVVAYYAHRLAGPPLLRMALMLLVLLNPWAPQVLAFTGLIDVFLDFRKWARPSAA
jgi:uncharacterized protein YybS (DUF2232 family)